MCVHTIIHTNGHNIHRIDIHWLKQSSPKKFRHLSFMGSEIRFNKNVSDTQTDT